MPQALKSQFNELAKVEAIAGAYRQGAQVESFGF
jgi:hypothetical protein